MHQRFFGWCCSYRSHFGCLCGKAGFRWSRHGATRCAGVKLITGTTYEHPWTHDLQLVATLMASWSSWIWPFKFATKSLISCEENMCKERGKRKSTSHESHKIHLDLHNATLLYTRHMCLIKVMPPPRSIGECTCKRVFMESPFCNEGKHAEKLWNVMEAGCMTHEYWWYTDISCHAFPGNQLMLQINSSVADFTFDRPLCTGKSVESWNYTMRILYMSNYLLALPAATLKELDCEHLGPTTQNCVAWKIKHRENWCLCTILLQQLCNLIMTSADGMW